MTEEAREMLKKIYIENKLVPSDIFTKKFKDGNSYTIITRSGIEKIIANHGIQIKYEPVHVSTELCVIKAIGCVEPCGTSIQTFGSACPANTQSSYLMEVAEKRCMARVTLKLLSLYEQGVFGEEESEEFRKDMTDGRPELA